MEYFIFHLVVGLYFLKLSILDFSRDARNYLDVKKAENQQIIFHIFALIQNTIQLNR